MFARIVARTLVALALLAAASPASAATLYAVGGNFGPSGGLSALYTVDPATAIMTWVGSLNVAGNFDNSIYNGGLAYDPYTDRLYALGCDNTTNSALFLVDRTDASMVRLGYCGGNPGAFCSGGLAFDVSSGRLFALGDWAGQNSSLLEINPSTGAATLVGGNGQAGTYMSGLSSDPQTGVLYANGFMGWNQNSCLFTINKASGEGTLVGNHGLTLGRQMNYAGAAVNPATGAMYCMGSFSGSSNHLYNVNKSTGAATSIAQANPNGIGVDGALTYVGIDVLDVGEAQAWLLPLRASPNPARAGVAFSCALAQAGRVELSVVDLAGRRVAMQRAGWLPAGAHTIRWEGDGPDGQRVPPGMYFATLRRDGALVGRTSVLVVR